jgi:hypothetical protein
MFYLNSLIFCESSQEAAGFLPWMPGDGFLGHYVFMLVESIWFCDHLPKMRVREGLKYKQFDFAPGKITAKLNIAFNCSVIMMKVSPNTGPSGCHAWIFSFFWRVRPVFGDSG